MRVIAGTLKGRRLKTPSWDGLRPTSDKLRETLFNILAARVPGARVLDGYAGTGALGIEALSRGAAQVTFVERERRAVALIESNRAIGAFALLAAMARSRLRLRWLAGGAWRIHDPAWWRAAHRIGKALGLRRPVLLLATTKTRVPLTWGTRVPVVLLPAEATGWPAERREAVLVHELAHVARGDALGHEIARIAAALFWLNPLVWVAVRLMRAERERACDDLVLATGTRASSYAGDLLEIARTVGGRPHLAAAALAMARPSELEGRLLAILNPCVPRRPASRGIRVAAGVLALTMIVPLAALRPAERAPIANEATVLPRVDGRTVPNAESPPASTQPTNAAPESRPGVREAVAPTPAPLATIVPPSPIAVDMPIADALDTPPAEDAGLARYEERSSDLETLIAVARAAAGLTSDDDAAGLLLDVIARGVRDGGLQAEVLRSAETIGSSHHRGRVLLALLRIGMVTGTESQFLSAAEGISGMHDRATVLTAFASADGLTNREVRTAFLRAATSVTSTHERTQLLLRVIQLPAFDAEAAIDVLPAIRAMSSTHEKANLLVALARRGVAEDAAVRDAFIAAAATLSSDSDYVRVMRAAGLSAADRKR
jgi:beta-lactamase regulating signal transducer with metallopeptidase domain